ncbi:Maf family protein [Neobacillus dielmonensis]|uniref:Maf family protein n=1 Tax=Neobacillus dielmonensis TaxID=1347369 RepID=UPI0005A60D87|nr:Maf family protein [Neobacillus dielmonensis]
MQNLILASSSPRRKELLENLRIPFAISSSNVDESFNPDLPPDEVVMELAHRKAQAVFEKNPDAFVIGSDTIVVADNRFLGKPADEAEAFQILKGLSGSQHEVYTGVSIVSPANSVRFYEKTEVWFWELTDDEIRSYVKSGEPLDKAGAYGIQGLGSMLVKKINGDYFAVVGLPVARTVRELKRLQFKLPY